MYSVSATNYQQPNQPRAGRQKPKNRGTKSCLTSGRPTFTQHGKTVTKPCGPTLHRGQSARRSGSHFVSNRAVRNGAHHHRSKSRNGETAEDDDEQSNQRCDVRLWKTQLGKTDEILGDGSSTVASSDSG